MSNSNIKRPAGEGIAIIGLGCYFPKANNIEQYWNNIINKVNCITEVQKDRWDSAIYFDTDKNALDKSYSKIGGFVSNVDPKIITKKYKIPPKVITAMDRSQRNALLATGDALEDAGYFDKEFDRTRTSVIIGNSMGGDKIDYTNLRVFMSGISESLKNGKIFSKIDSATQMEIIDELEKNVKSELPEITEDALPGELANVIAGRIGNALNLTGPNFSVDAACASSIASIREAVTGLRNYDFDMAVAGGTDYMMGPGPYVKFSKIGAISPSGSRPFDAKANGFVMGEGTGIFILKRVSDAREDGDKIYAVIRGIGASNDGKGKGITAPNPNGQISAIKRAFEDANYSSNTVQYIEAHGTATIVGDLTELESLIEVWDPSVDINSVAIGSIKSNIGHTKAAAGSASIIKVALALHKKILPPSINYENANPNINFGNIPFRVITDSEEWPKGIDSNPRRANVSAFGFGGTNFHVALEEDTGENGMPEMVFHQMDAKRNQNNIKNQATGVCDYSHKRYLLSDENEQKLEGEAVMIGGSSWEDIDNKLNSLKEELSSNSNIGLRDLGRRFNIESNSMDYRLGISSFSIKDFLGKFDIARQGFDNIKKRMVLKNKGLFFGEGLLEKKKSLAKVCVMFPGQGAQYTNMLKDLYNKYKVVKETFEEADEVMHGIIGKGISEIIFLHDDATKEEMDASELQLKQTEITQPGVLTADYAMFRLLRSFGIHPDVSVGHSLGEYGALVAAEVISFKDALYAVSARGREIANVKIDDVGKMASVPGPVEKTEEILKDIDGYAIIANKNCHSQTVVAGDSPSVLKVLEKCNALGIPAQEIPVSHAFHSKIVAPACLMYTKVIESLTINSPKIDIVANLTGDYYPKSGNVRKEIIEILVKHIANPVEFIQQVERMYADGVNVFVEAGPKRTLSSFVLNILDKKPHLAMATNHPKRGGICTLNDALAAMSTQGFDIDWNGTDESGNKMDDPDWRLREKFLGKPEITVSSISSMPAVESLAPTKPIEKELEVNSTGINEIDRKIDVSSTESSVRNFQDISIENLYGDFKAKQKELLSDIMNLYSQKSDELFKDQLQDALYYKNELKKYNINLERIVISGVSMGLPGERFRVFDDNSFDRISEGQNMIDSVTDDIKMKMVEKNITRLVKKTDGEATFDTITDKTDVVKLAARKGGFDFKEDYGFNQDFVDKVEITAQLAISAGIEALRDAGIPLIMSYKQTSTNKLFPSHWGLSEKMQDDTGIIFVSAFPGENALIEEVSKSLSYKLKTKSKQELIQLYSSLIGKVKDEKFREELSDWYTENYSILRDGEEKDNTYKFNRKFLFRILAMGHSQFAELIKAKGPNVHINTACSSTTTAVAMAEDWIRIGRAKRVVIIGSDDITSNNFIEYALSGFLAVGAASTGENVKETAIPFDKRRNGLVVGMGAVGIVVERESEVKKRGMEPIVEIVSTIFLNSAFHITRLDVNHISQAMEIVVSKAEDRLNIKREELAKQLVFMSHETYTPARGGSASAEINSLRNTFGDNYKDIVVTNTKGFTGHSMGAGIEDIVIVKALQTGKIPPIANYKEVDPELGNINLSKGGYYKDKKYGLRLGAGFGSQIAMSIIKLVSQKDDRVVDQTVYNEWLKDLSKIDNPELEIVKRTLRIKDDGSIIENNRESANKKTQIEAKVDEATVSPIPDQKSESMPEVFAKNASAGKDQIIQTKIIQIVEEKTGYPEDLIEFDLDMESDLGIDTVKQAEMFGMIREAFEISRDESIKIKDFPTLNHVVEFVKEKSPQKFENESAPVVISAADSIGTDISANNDFISPKTVGQGEIHEKLLRIVEEKTGYPQDLIEFDLDMESDLGIDTVKQAEMFGLIRDTFEISRDESIKIKDFPTLNHVVEFVKKMSPLDFDDTTLTNMALANTEAVASAVSLSPESVQNNGKSINEIQKKIIQIVEEKTGYPEDLIEFDLDMESDLGIDTVKQAEMFGMIREAFEISRDESIKIKDFPTLNHVVEFVKEKSPRKFENESAPMVISAADSFGTDISANNDFISPKTVGQGEIHEKLLRIVEEKTGYPQDLIEFDLDMESDLGIDTVKQAEMFGLIRDTFEISRDESIKIKDFPTLNHVVEFVKEMSPLDFDDTTSTNMALANTEAVASAVSVSPESVQYSGKSINEIQKKIIQIVEEKTGYPEDLIEFDLDMESDLGIDTVKQAEMFGMIREAFEISRDESIKIKDFPTLHDVVEFVKTKSALPMEPITSVSVSEGIVSDKFEEPQSQDSKIRRMTTEMIEEVIDLKKEPRFNMEGYNIIITDDGRGIANSLKKILIENKAKSEIIELKDLSTKESVEAAISKVKSSGKINGIIHLAPLAETNNIDRITFQEWKIETFRRVKSLFLIAKSFQEEITENAKTGNAFILSATEMGGSFGFDSYEDNTPINGGTIGLLKALKKELNNVAVKIVDLSKDRKPANISRVIFNEVQFGSDRVEVGYVGKTRFVPQVIYNNLNKEVKPEIKIDEESVVLIVGGGYGITSEVAKDIAKNFKSRIVLLSRKGIPSNIEELASLDENGLKELKNKIIEELKAVNTRVTPVMINNKFKKYTTAIEKYKNVKDMERLGARSVEYFECDVMDHVGMSKVLESIKKKYGRIDGIINGAGIEQSKLMEDKNFDHFCKVFDIKADGCFNIVELTKKDNIKFQVIFSSIVGRFGNSGQTDYSAANELLNKYSQQINTRFNGKTKTVSIGWSGWDEIGMATRGSIKEIFEDAGIELIKVWQGRSIVRNEILYGHDREIIIAGGLGYFDDEGMVVGDRSKKLTAISKHIKSNREKYPMIDEILSLESGQKILVKKKLDTKMDLYLKDHSIENIPYLPAVMGIECFAEAANLLYPDKIINLMRDIRFNIPVKLFKNKPVDLFISIKKQESSGNDILLKAKLETRFYNKAAVKMGDDKLHFEADILMSDKGAKKKKVKVDKLYMSFVEQYKKDGSILIKDNEIYKRFFHGPEFQVHGGIIGMNDDTVFGIADTNSRKSNKFSFVKKPDFITNPMANEAAFQNAGLFTMAKKNKKSLPDTIKELFFARIPSDTDLYIKAKYIGSDDMKYEYDTQVIDSNGNIYSEMKGYKMITTGELTKDEKF